MGFVLFLILATAIFGIMFILTVINRITSFLFSKPNNTYSNYGNRAKSQNRESYSDMNKAYKKIFSKEEGEYVKFEEIKE